MGASVPYNPLQGFQGAGHDSTAVEIVKENSALVLSLLGATADCVKILGIDGKLKFMNHAGLCVMEIEDFGLVAGEYWWDLWPADSRSQLKSSVEKAAKGGHARFAAMCPTAKGTPKWWDVTVLPVMGTDGEVDQILAISRDVSEIVARNKALEQRTAELERALHNSELLRREVDHRVKNSLGIVGSLLRMQAHKAPEHAQASLRSAASRVQVIAQVHDRLYRIEGGSSVDLGVYVRQLCGDLCQALQGADTVKFEIDQETLIVVKPQSTIAIGLALAELIANAVRHGGADKMHIGLRLEDGDVILEVIDNGGGLPLDFDPMMHSGVGMQVVRAMTGQINATLRWENPPFGGACFIMQFPHDETA